MSGILIFLLKAKAVVREWIMGARQSVARIMYIKEDIMYYRKKYYFYDSEYSDPKSRHPFKGKVGRYIGGPPCLFDALLTSPRHLSVGFHSVYIYDEEVEEDIRRMVTLFPDTLQCNVGYLRCRYDVPPLAAACFNDQIPLHIVEFLLQNGADKNQLYYFNNQQTTITEDIQHAEDPERSSAVRELLSRY